MLPFCPYLNNLVFLLLMEKTIALELSNSNNINTKRLYNIIDEDMPINKFSIWLYVSAL